MVLSKIRELGGKGSTATEIQIALDLDEGLEGRRKPALRTLQEILRELVLTDTSDPWSLGDAEPGDGAATRALLDVIAVVLSETRGRKKHITKAEAGWIGRVLDAAPDLPPTIVYRIAQLYLQTEQRGEPTAPIDHVLAFAPWTSKRARERYFTAIAEGWMSADPRGSLWVGSYLLGLGAIPDDVLRAAWADLDEAGRLQLDLAGELSARFDEAMDWSGEDDE